MRSTLSSLIGRLAPFALAAVALAVAVAQHAPAMADSSPAQQVCGSVDLASADSATAAKAFDCFSAAFAHCTAASLTATGQESGVPVTRTFQTLDGGDDHGCSVSETIERGPAGAQTTDAELCRQVSRDKDGLSITGCSSRADVSLRVSAAVSATSMPQSQPVITQPEPAKT